MEDNRKVTKFFYWFVGSIFILMFISIIFSGEYVLLIIIPATALLIVIVFFGISLFNLIVFTPVLWLISLVGGKMDSRKISKSHKELEEGGKNNE